MVLALDIITSFIITIVVLAALSPVITTFDSTFLTGTGVNQPMMGLFYYLIFAVPLFLTIGGIILVLKPRLFKTQEA